MSGSSVLQLIFGFYNHK